MPKVLFIAPIYNYYPILVHALQLQTVGAWELLLIHDGPNESGLKAQLERIADPRVRYYETPSRHNDWGHSLRALALEQVAQDRLECDYLVITNADNYYCPGFIEILSNGFDSAAVAVYCDMVHNHHQWRVLQARLEYRWIDCGCIMARRNAALEVGWTSREYAADWTYAAALVARFGAHRIKRVDSVLFVHN